MADISLSITHKELKITQNTGYNNLFQLRNYFFI